MKKQNPALEYVFSDSNLEKFENRIGDHKDSFIPVLFWTVVMTWTVLIQLDRLI